MIQTLHAYEAKQISEEYNNNKDQIFIKIREAAEKGIRHINIDTLPDSIKIYLEEIGYVVSSDYEEDCYTIEW
jgi:hypothetical protein